MAFTTVPAAGVTLTASTLSSLITEVRPLFARKTSDETVNNTAALQNDDHLVLSVAASTTYEFVMRLRISTGTTPDFKAAFTYPAGLTMFYDVKTVTTGGTALLAFDLTEASVTAVEGSQTSVMFEGLVIVSTTAGSLQLQWAQNTANASNTSVLAGSYLKLVKVE